MSRRIVLHRPLYVLVRAQRDAVGHLRGHVHDSATLTNGSGQRVLVTVAAHLTLVDGEVTVDHAIDSVRCVGKPV
jgi:hypothetical protein